MNTYLAVAHTYTSRRWMVLASVGGLLCLAAMLFAMGRASDNMQGGVMGMNSLALPLMIGGLLLAMQAKYQFVHPRARLTPGFATPHIVVLIVLLLCLVMLYPMVASWHLHYAPLGALAFSALFVALVVWQIQVMSGLLSLASLALFFSYFQPTIAAFWVADAPGLALPRIAVFLVGLVGIGAWLWRLTIMREQDGDYLVPVQSGFSQQSRMEKSEARQLISRWISRNPLQRLAVDSWHDRLATLPPQSEADRPRLLRYGMWMVPMPLMAVQMLVMIVVIALVQFLMFNSMKTGEGGIQPGPMVLGQLAILSLVTPFIGCHMLATRRTRLGQDLLLPLTREALIDGFRRQLVAMLLWTLGPAAIGAAVAAPLIAPDVITLDKVFAAVATGIAIQPLMLALSLRLALIQSGLKRMFGMVLVLYLLMGIAVVSFSTFTKAGYGWGALIVVMTLALGIWSLKWARRAWLNAEFG